MRPTLYGIDELEHFIKANVVVTMPQIKNVMGTGVYKTAWRKLKQLNYLPSYSHRSSFYTLRRLAKFNRRGLWTYNDVHFSKHGTLMSTLAHFVGKSKDGFFADELEQLLSVGVRVPLSRLIERGSISRKKISNLYLYCSTDSNISKQQILARNLMESAEQELPDEVRSAIVIFFSVLGEKERRLYAGLEAIKYGFGGDKWIANLLGMHPTTVARGRKELLLEDVEIDRTRKKGGGRKLVEKKHPKSSKKLKL